jgi:hypothetical protein
LVPKEFDDQWVSIIASAGCAIIGPGVARARAVTDEIDNCVRGHRLRKGAISKIVDWRGPRHSQGIIITGRRGYQGLQRKQTVRQQDIANNIPGMVVAAGETTLLVDTIKFRGTCGIAENELTTNCIGGNESGQEIWGMEELIHLRA